MKEELNFRIFGRNVGRYRPIFVIAEIGLCHNAKIDQALELIRIAKSAGCDAVKFQKRDVATLAIGSVLKKPYGRFEFLGHTYGEVRAALEFSQEEYLVLMAEARKMGIPFLCTPFDPPSVKFLEDLGVQAYKIASHGLTNLPLIEMVANIGKPTIMSTGMATVEEIDRAVEVFASRDCPLAILHCVSSYPTRPEVANLRHMNWLRERYGRVIGYSGHEETSYFATTAAVAMGAAIVERHITLDNDADGFDHRIALNPEDLGNMINAISTIEKMFGQHERRLLEEERGTRGKYHVSVVSAGKITAGTTIQHSMLICKNPGTGIPSHEIHSIVGMTARMDIEDDTLLSMGMFD